VHTYSTAGNSGSRRPRKVTTSSSSPPPLLALVLALLALTANAIQHAAVAQHGLQAEGAQGLAVPGSHVVPVAVPLRLQLREAVHVQAEEGGGAPLLAQARGHSGDERAPGGVIRGGSGVHVLPAGPQRDAVLPAEARGLLVRVQAGARAKNSAAACSATGSQSAAVTPLSAQQ
jgi:hypothetical protein